ncbi:MAG: ParB N-terminal domain-containing protein [Massilia sp.]|uniref:ParB/RepB/Spo0J family partition protein n=1 Tax=Massilia sp. TaxID=1882437 RepID=UPI002FC8F3E7
MSKLDNFVSLKVAAEKKIHGDDVSKVTSFAVAPHLLEIEEGFNARPLNPDHVAEMSLAMRNGATFPPLEVRVDDGHILIVDGHHRHAAALQAISEGFEIKALDCRHFRGNDADRVAHMLNSASGLALTPLQLGIQYRKLIGFGWTEPQIANRRGKSVQHVKDMIQLAEANSDVHQAVNAGEISGTAALKMVKQHGSRAGAVIRESVEQAKAEGKTKVKPKELPGRPHAKVSDKQIIDWLTKHASINAGSGDQAFDTRCYEMDFLIPKTVEGTTDLRTLIASAIIQSTTT